jgi:hypothetical protein
MLNFVKHKIRHLSTLSELKNDLWKEEPLTFEHENAINYYL